MDESGISSVVNKLPKVGMLNFLISKLEAGYSIEFIVFLQVISPTGKKCVSKKTSAERGQLVSVVCCMSAAGNYVPPAMIFPRVRMNEELFRDVPVGTLPLVSESGYMNSDLFMKWLQHFKNNVFPTAENPVLLILDNHKSHCTLAGIEFCRENNIILLGLPPHCSHKLQPLDRTFFAPLKCAFSKESDKWIAEHQKGIIQLTMLAKLFASAYYRACSIQNAMSGFICTGIKPFNPDIFSDVDFMPAEVTDRKIFNFTIYQF